jgi:hypothetical protein
VLSNGTPEREREGERERGEREVDEDAFYHKKKRKQ